MSELRIELTGVTRIVVPDGRVVELDRFNAALFALLAAEGRIERRRAVALLWPDKEPKNGRNILRQRIFNLRHDSGHPLVDGVDVLTLAAGVRTDMHPGSDAPAATGDLLEGHGYDDLEELDEWVQLARARWRAARRRTLQQAADTFERAGRLAEAAACAARLIDDDPLAEDGYRRAMRVFYLDGNRTAALDVHARWRAVLAADARAAPSADIDALARLIERSDTLDAAARVAPPLALLRTPSLVAREGEWAQLERALERGRVALLRGEPGIGKSRLARDFARAHGDAPVCSARPGDAAQPFALLARLLRQLAARYGAPPADEPATAELARIDADFGAAPDTPAGPARLAAALHAQFDRWAARGWSFVVIDDLHFADAASLDTLLAWLDTAGARAVGRVLAVRAAEQPPALVQWLEGHGADDCTMIDLAPLDGEGLHALLAALALPGLDAAAWAPRLLRHTGGNPLFVIETLLACFDGGGLLAFAGDAPLPAPEGVGRAIDRRLGHLSAPALRLARVAALAGADCGVHLFAAVLGCHVVDLADAWRELEQRQVMRDGAFAHDLVLEAVVRSVPDVVARALHADVARALEQRDMPAGRIAQHWRLAQQWEPAARHYLRAADAAALHSRRDDEIALLEQAATCAAEAGDRAGACAARLRRAETMVMAGSLAHARTEIAALRAATDDARQHLALAVLEVKAALAAVDGGAAENAARTALAMAENLGDAGQAFRARQLLGSALSLRGDATGALAVLEPLAAPGVTFASARERCEFEGTLGYVLATSGRRRESLPHLREAARLAQELGDAVEAMPLLSNLAGVLSTLGNVAEAAAMARAAQALSLHAGAKAGIAVASNETVLGLAATSLGRFDEAEAVFGAALERFRRAGASVWIVATEGMLANLYVLLGQPARARQAMSPIPEGTPPARVARRLVVEARIEQAGGRSGLAKLRAAVALLEGAQRPIDQLSAQVALAPACPPDETLDLVRTIHARSVELNLDAVGLTARVREADALRRCGDHAAAAALARDLVATADACWPHDLYRGEYWWVLFQVLDAAGDTAAAEQALAAGNAWLRAVVPHVPAAWRDSFLHRQPINRALLTTAGRRLDLAGGLAAG